MIQSGYKYLILVSALILFWSCTNRRMVGEYKNGNYNSCPYIIHLDSDSTGYYTWWTDIRMENNGTWSVSNDTVFFTDQSLVHQEDKFFIIKKNKLIGQDGTIYKKMNLIQRKTVYRGR